MAITTDAALTAVATVVSGGIGWLLALASEKRPKLIAHYGHVSAFPLKNPPTDGPTGIHTHAVVIRNAGGKPATHVRISHHYLPQEVSIFPPVAYTTEPVPNSGPDIVIPLLVPGQQVTVNYLYFSPMTFDAVTSGVRCDEGLARVVDVLLTPQPRRGVRHATRLFVALGAMTLVYFAVLGIKTLILR